MKILCLTMRITDLLSRTSVVHRFLHSPVTVGSAERRTVCLDAPGVSELHGVFTFDDRSIEYVDLGSLTGSLVDGVPVTAQLPIPVRETSVVRVGAFDISVRASQVLPPDSPGRDSPAISPQAPHDDGAAELASFLATRLRRERLQALLAEWSTKRLLARCLAVFEILGDVVVELRPEILANVRPPLRASATVDDVIAFLLDPSGGDEAIEALYAQVLALLRPGSIPPVSEGTS